MPIAMPTSVLLFSAPGNDAAYSDNTGSTRNMPSIRSAYTPDSVTPARHSDGNI